VNYEARTGLHEDAGGIAVGGEHDAMSWTGSCGGGGGGTDHLIAVSGPP